MLKDFANHILIMNERDQAHLSLALGTGERINLINFLDQACPIFSKSLVGQLRLHNTGDLIISSGFFPFSASYITIIAIITGHLFAFIGHVGAPVCVRHAHAGMAANHSSASNTFVCDLSFD